MDEMDADKQHNGAETPPEAPVETAAPEQAGPGDTPPQETSAASESADVESPVVESPESASSSEEEATESEATAVPASEPEEESASVTSFAHLRLPPRDDREDEPPLSDRDHVAPEIVSLDQVLDDHHFQLRPEGDTSLLATDLARLGQLFPVDVRLVGEDSFQVICGFRRVAALRFLQRDQVLARVHENLRDDDALLMALADAIHYAPVTPEELQALREKLDREERLGSEARDMLDKALSGGDDLAPENVDDEVDADELAAKVALQLGDINQDLALLADVFASLDSRMKETLLQQLRYSSELVTFLEGK